MQKANKGQHTKKKPSSSSHAAAAMGGQTGFRGFSRGVVQVEGTLSNEFQLAFKKLSKKDSTTKLKGLSELSTLFKTNLKQEDTKVVLQHWVTSFRRMALINNLRVRVAIHKTFSELLSIAKKDLGPFLKSIIGPWLCHMFDSCKEVSAAAHLSFRTAIPLKKHSEAFAMCKKEILAHVEQNFAQTAQTLSSGKSVIKIEERYGRVISSSILALGHFIETLPENVNAELLEEKYKSMFDQKFWKFLSIKKFTIIRKAAYQLIPILCNKLKPLVESNLTTLSPLVLGLLSETESDAQKNLWECLLTFMQCFPESWTHVDPRKHVLPKLWNALRTGGCGAPTVVYPSLLPLLSLIPVSVIGDGTGFHNEFFKNLWKGLDNEDLSATGTTALVNAFAECVIYFLTRKRGAQAGSEKVKEAGGENDAVAEFLLCNVVLSTIKYLLDSERPPANLSQSLGEIVMKASRIPQVQGGVKVFVPQLQGLVIETIIAEGKSAETLDTRFNKLATLLAQLRPIIDEKGESAELFAGMLNEAFGSILKLLEGNDISPHHVMLLAQLSKTFPEILYGRFPEGEVSYMKEQLLPWAARWVKEGEPFRGAISLLLDIARSCLDYTASKGNPVPPLWSLLVDAFISSNDHLLLLLRKVCHGGIATWEDSRLNAIGLRLAESLLAKQPLTSSDIALLAALIGVGAVTNECIEQIAEGARGTLEEVLKEEVTHSNEAEPAQGGPLQRAVTVVPLVESIVTATALPSAVTPCRLNLLCSVLKYASLANNAATSQEDDAHFSPHPVLMGLITAARRIWKACRGSLLPSLSSSEREALRGFVASSLCSPEGSVRTLPAALYSETELAELAADVVESLGKEASEKLLDEVFFKENEWEEVLRATPHRWFDALSLPPVILGAEPSSDEPGKKKEKEKEKEDAQVSIPHSGAYETLARMTLFAAALAKRLGTNRIFIENSPEFHRLWLLSSLMRSCMMAGHTLVEALPTSTSLLSPPNDSVWRRFLSNRDQIVAQIHEAVTLLEQPGCTALVERLCNSSYKQGGQDALALYLLLPSAVESINAEALTRLFTSRAGEIGTSESVSATIACGASSLAKLSPEAGHALIQKAGESLSKSVADILNRNMRDHETLSAARQVMDVLSKLLESTPATQEEVKLCLGLVGRLYPAVSPFSLLGPTEAPLPAEDDMDRAATTLLKALLNHREHMAPSDWKSIIAALRLCVNRVKPPQAAQEISHGSYGYYSLLSLVQAVLSALDTIAKEDSGILNELQEISKSTLQKLVLPLIVSLNEWKEGGARCTRLLQRAESVCTAINSSVLLSCQQGLEEASEQLHNLLFSPCLEGQRMAYRLLLHLTIGDVQKRVKESAAPSKAAPSQADKEPDTTEVKEEPPISAPLRSIIEDPVLQVAEGEKSVGYLLAWSLVFDGLSVGDSAAKSALSTYFRQSGVLSPFLFTLFHHMDLQSDTLGLSASDIASFKVAGMDRDEKTLQKYALHLYLRTLTAMPVLVRLWWTDDCDRKLATLVDKYTTAHMSTLLIANEMASIINYTSDAENFRVKGSTVSREVVATYEKDDMHMSIVIRLPASYPLRTVEIECKKRLGVTETQWRKWMLSMTTMFLTQDGSVLDAVLLWKQNLDKHFEGVECCPICYSVFHISDYSLPRLACRTCHNKFHSACVYKWVRVSHNTECPLCKSPIL